VLFRSLQVDKRGEAAPDRQFPFTRSATASRISTWSPRMLRRLLPILALGLLFVALAAAPSRAQDEESLTHVSRAAAAEQEEDWPAALNEYSLALQTDSTSSYLLSRVVHCLFQMGRDDEVMSFTRVLWKRDSTQAGAAAEAAEMAFMHGRVDEAAEWYRAATRAKPDDPRPWTQLALVYDQLQRPAEADSALAMAARAAPDNPGVLYYLGWSRARAGRPAEAVEPLQQLMRTAPRYPHGWPVLGQVLEELHRFDEAREAYGHAARGEGAPSDRVPGQRGLARVSFMSGHPEQALEPIQSLLAATPADVQLRRLRCDVLLRLGRAAEALADADTLVSQEPDNIAWAALRSDLLWRANDPERARGALEAFAGAHPASHRIHELLATLEARRGRLEQALQELDAAQRLAPDSVSVYYLRGQMLAEAQRNAEAESVLTIVTGKDSTHLPALFALGVVREKQGRLEASEAAFRRVLALEPRNAQAHNYLGYMLADRGLRLEESLREIDLALSEDPGNSAYLDSRGWALFRLGRALEARAVLESAIRNGGQDAVIHEHLGDVLSFLKLHRLAIQAYQDALARDPGNESLKSKLRNSQESIK
jgi:tetratricopeptide (TPR) repeat protein